MKNYVKIGGGAIKFFIIIGSSRYLRCPGSVPVQPTLPPLSCLPRLMSLHRGYGISTTAHVLDDGAVEKRFVALCLHNKDCPKGFQYVLRCGGGKVLVFCPGSGYIHYSMCDLLYGISCF